MSDAKKLIKAVVEGKDPEVVIEARELSVAEAGPLVKAAINKRRGMNSKLMDKVWAAIDKESYLIVKEVFGSKEANSERPRYYENAQSELRREVIKQLGGTPKK